MERTLDSAYFSGFAWSPMATLVLFAGVSLVGCSSKDNAVATFPTSGQVTFKGQPAEGARVFFFFDSKILRGKVLPTPQATVDEAGNFRVSCFGEEDGAPVGEYRIAIVWREESSPNLRGDQRPPDRLRGRYGNPRRSGLKATVVEGDNVLSPFQLK